MFETKEPYVVVLARQIIDLHEYNEYLKEKLAKTEEDLSFYKKRYKSQCNHSDVMMGNLLKASMCMDLDKAREVFKVDENQNVTIK